MESSWKAFCLVMEMTRLSIAQGWGRRFQTPTTSLPTLSSLPSSSCYTCWILFCSSLYLSANCWAFLPRAQTSKATIRQHYIQFESTSFGGGTMVHTPGPRRLLFQTASATRHPMASFSDHDENSDNNNNSLEEDPKSKDFLDWLYHERDCQGEEGVVQIMISSSPTEAATTTTTTRKTTTTATITSNRGVFAAKDIQRGDFIFAIPFESALVIEEVETSDAERGYQFMKLQQQLREQPDFEIAWKPYLDMLPTRPISETATGDSSLSFFDPTPDFWSNEDIDKLELPQMIDLVLEKKLSIEDLAEEQGIDLAELQFSTWLVNSRGITLVDNENNQDNEEIDDEMMLDYLNHASNTTCDHHHAQDDDDDENDVGTTCVLIPLLDMINHSSENFNTFLSVLGDDDENEDSPDSSEEQLYYAVVASRDIRKGEELLLSYGSQEDSSLELLLHYGFIPEENPYDVDFIAMDADDDHKKSSYWTTSLEDDEQRLEEISRDPSKGQSQTVEHTILKFRIRMKKAQQEYKELIGADDPSSSS